MRKFFLFKKYRFEKLRIVVTNYAKVFRYQKPGRLGAVLVIGLDWEHYSGEHKICRLLLSQCPQTWQLVYRLASLRARSKEHYSGEHKACRQAQMQFHGFGGWFASRQTRGTVGEHIGGAQTCRLSLSQRPQTWQLVYRLASLRARLGRWKAGCIRPLLAAVQPAFFLYLIL